jgi:DNA-binding MarR family transcriptional regulator
MRKNKTEEIHTLGALLRLPYETLVARTYAELAASGFDDIRPAHSSVFRHILPDGSRLTELAERAQLTKQSMAYLVDALQQQGYVDFVPDPRDGRAKLLHLTPRGLAFQEAAIVVSQRIETGLSRQLGAKNLAQLRTLLEQLPSTSILRAETTIPMSLRDASTASTSRQHSMGRIHRHVQRGRKGAPDPEKDP